MTTTNFDSDFKRILTSELTRAGFKRVKLQSCMCPEYLYNRDRLWFSISWDLRDQYLDVSLGHLYWFKDVMARAVVIGDFSNYDKNVKWNSINSETKANVVLDRIAKSLSGAIDTYRVDYEKIYQDFRLSRSKRSGINIDEFIGKEVSKGELDEYKA